VVKVGQNMPKLSSGAPKKLCYYSRSPVLIYNEVTVLKTVCLLWCKPNIVQYAER